MSGNIDFENIKWGSFTKQFQAYKQQYPKSKVKDLDAFAKMILRNPKKFQPKTQKRASFYLNVIIPQHHARGGAESDSESEEEVGGKLSISSLKNLLNQSYDKKPKDYLDYELDKELSGQRVQVYRNPKTNQVVVSHRGTQGIHDIGNDLKYALGFDLHNTERFKHAQDIQRKAEAKYGAENITTIGHSLGSKLARDVGQNSKEVIELNPAYNIPDALKKKSEKTHTIRTHYDPVSFLVPLLKGKDKNTTTIESKTVNPLAEHTVGVLDRADQEKEIGAGLKKKSIKELKALAKSLPKEHRIKLTKIKKGDLVSHLCKCGGASVVQKGIASNMRGYFDTGTDQKQALNQIIHSGDPAPAPSIFNDITNSYDPNVDKVIHAYWEHYLYNWYKDNGYLGIVNEDGKPEPYFVKDKATGQYVNRLNKKGNLKQPVPAPNLDTALGFPKGHKIAPRGILLPPPATPAPVPDSIY